jgi:ribosomal protein S18 acetylase RimI-like enzyme
LNIRRRISADAAGIAKVHIDSWKTAYRGIVSQSYLEGVSYSTRETWWLERLSNLPKFVFVAEDESRQPGESIIGFCAGGTNRSTDDSVYSAELRSIYILERYRRQGVGQALLKSLVGEFIENGFDSMIVWVLAKNPYLAFYEKLGGKYVQTQDIQIGGSAFVEIAFGWTNLRGLIETLTFKEEKGIDGNAD